MGSCDEVQPQLICPVKQDRDPFERMIMAQSELEQIPVITYDPAFKTGLIEVIPE